VDANYNSIDNKLDSLVSSLSSLANNQNNLGQNINKLQDSVEKFKDDKHRLEIKVEKQYASIKNLAWFTPIIVSLIVASGVCFMVQSNSSVKESINTLILK